MNHCTSLERYCVVVGNDVETTLKGKVGLFVEMQCRNNVIAANRLVATAGGYVTLPNSGITCTWRTVCIQIDNGGQVDSVWFAARTTHPHVRPQCVASLNEIKFSTQTPGSFLPLCSSTPRFSFTLGVYDHEFNHGSFGGMASTPTHSSTCSWPTTSAGATSN